MADHRQILDAVYRAVDEVNLLLPTGKRLEKSETTHIVGDGATLDSLGFLNFMMLAETKINDACPTPVNLAEKLLEDLGGDPPETLGELVSLVASLQEA